jgi:hypothetical protein
VVVSPPFVMCEWKASKKVHCYSSEFLCTCGFADRVDSGMPSCFLVNRWKCTSPHLTSPLVPTRCKSHG